MRVKAFALGAAQPPPSSPRPAAMPGPRIRDGS
jgi:hypothetical protein